MIRLNNKINSKIFEKLSGIKNKDEKPEEVKNSLDDEINDLMAKLEIEKDRTISDEDLQNILEEPAAHPELEPKTEPAAPEQPQLQPETETRNT